MIIEKRLEKLNKVRKEGYYPGVLFGKEFGTNSVSIMTKPEEFNSAFSKFGMTKTFKVELDGASHTVYFKGVERNILKPGYVVHFSLLKVSKGDKVSAQLQIKVLNESEIEKQGMIVIQSLHEMEVEYPVGSDITNLEIDVHGCKLGDTIHVSDVKLPEGCRIVSLHAEDVVASIAYPKVIKEEPKPADTTAAATADASATATATTPAENAENKESK